MEFSFNGTASVLNVSAKDPGGEDDPACIPKMANLNSQVGLCMPLSLKLHIHFHCPHLCHSHFKHVANDSSQSKHGDHTCFEALGCTQKGNRPFIKQFMIDIEM